MKYTHKSILSKQITTLIANNETNKIINKTIIDCTAGEGGHTQNFLRISQNNTLILIDRDKDILNIAKQRLMPIQGNNKLIFQNQNFSEIKNIIHNNNIQPNLILYDLGISMYHYKISKRGFSFRDNSKLDMRLNKNDSISAYEIINSFTKEDIREILLTFGEEYKAGKIANKIIIERKKKKIEYTNELANIISNCKANEPYKKNKIHPATKTFQALRMAVNKELKHIAKSLIDAIYLLDKESKIAVITFHSIEDRLVKQIFNFFQKKCICPENQPICTCFAEKTLKKLNKKPITPDSKEKIHNPSARSSKLRIVEKIYEEKKMDKQKQNKKEELYKRAKKIFYSANKLDYSNAD